MSNQSTVNLSEVHATLRPFGRKVAPAIADPQGKVWAVIVPAAFAMANLATLDNVTTVEGIAVKQGEKMAKRDLYRDANGDLVVLDKVPSTGASIRSAEWLDNAATKCVAILVHAGSRKARQEPVASEPTPQPEPTLPEPEPTPEPTSSAPFDMAQLAQLIGNVVDAKLADHVARTAAVKSAASKPRRGPSSPAPVAPAGVSIRSTADGLLS